MENVLNWILVASLVLGIFGDTQHLCWSGGTKIFLELSLQLYLMSKNACTCRTSYRKYWMIFCIMRFFSCFYPGVQEQAHELAQIYTQIYKSNWSLDLYLYFLPNAFLHLWNMVKNESSLWQQCILKLRRHFLVCKFLLTLASLFSHCQQREFKYTI